MRTLTVLPVPGRDAGNMASSLPWFPVVGLILGWILCGLAHAAQYVVDMVGPIFAPDTWYPSTPWHGGVAALLLIGGVVLTRGLHLDGLADWADGFWGGHDRDTVLRIMKDSHTGAFGNIAVTCMLLRGKRLLSKYSFSISTLYRRCPPGVRKGLSFPCCSILFSVNKLTLR